MFTFKLTPYLDLAFETRLEGSVKFESLLPIDLTDAGMNNF